MLFFPIQVDVPMSRWPWMNWAMMLVLIALHGVTMTNPEAVEPYILGIENAYRAALDDYGDHWMFMAFGMPDVPEESPISWLSHMFLHADIPHLVGNLIFMWVFGNAVCAKIGNLFYPVLWITCGLAGAVAEFAVDPNIAALGSSAAIFGIVGFYLIFYAFNDIKLFWMVIFRFGVFELSSFWVVGMYVVLDVLGVVSKAEGVGHLAHLGGCVSGAVLAVALVRFGILEASDQERVLFAPREVNVEPQPERTPLARHGRVATEAARAIVLNVRKRSGRILRVPLRVLLERAVHDKTTQELEVSTDARSWQTFREWRAANGWS